MRISIVNTLNDKVYQIEIDPTQSVEDLKVLIEVESCLPIAEQQLIFQNDFLDNNVQTVGEAGISEDDLIILQKKIEEVGPYSVPAASGVKASDKDFLNDFFGGFSNMPPPMSMEDQLVHRETEQIKSHFRSNPTQLQELVTNNPEMATALQNSFQDPNNRMLFELIKEKMQPKLTRIRERAELERRV